MTARYLTGDVFEQMATLPDRSVDLVLTSPPFLALRSYLPADHPDKAKEIGSEPNPAAFIDTLLRLTAEWDRLLAPHGSICIELGDTYAGGGQGPDANHSGPERPVAASKGEGWPLAKSLALIPEMYRIALAYGVNPLTGEASPAGRWRVRNVVRWHRPNPPVGALGDKFRPSTSDMVIACKSAKRYFDLDAVRMEHRYLDSQVQNGKRATNTRGSRADDGGTFSNVGNPAGAPPLDTWVIPTHPYKGSHYATWPPDLCVRPIKAMCPPGGTVLDPFAGSGTTLMVATGHGRDAIGIDLDPRNVDLARQRVGMFLTEGAA